ncbi:MAG: DNA repair protein RecO [bacterium]
MPLRKSEAVVIRTADFGEADRIVTFYTKNFGKVRTVANGARRLRSRFNGSTLPFTYGHLVFFEREHSHLHSISQYDVIESFHTLREDLDKMVYGIYIGELIDEMIPSGRERGLFELLLSTLLWLKELDGVESLIRAFEVRFMGIAGFAMKLNSCISCNRRDDISKFSVKRGGVICGRCAPKIKGDLLDISPDSIGFMLSAQTIDVKKIGRLTLSPNDRKQLKALMRDYISHYAEKELKSLKALDELLSTTPPA